MFLFSPILSLFLSEPLRDHTYRQIAMHIVALKETKGLNDSESISKRLFHYVVRNTIVNPGNLVPYEDKALGYLVNGYEFCDYDAEILAALCAEKGLNARYCMLMDGNGVSPHTIVEVEIGGKWRVFDPTEGNYYTNSQGQLATLEELSDNPSIIFNHKRFICLKNNFPDRYNSLINTYKSIFPFREKPQRSSSKVKKIMPPDRLAYFYYSIFKGLFLFPYQELYLKKKTAGMQDEDRLYYIARNYHLVHRTDDAIRFYGKLLIVYPRGKYFERANFYLGLLYLDQREDYINAIKMFSKLNEDGNILQNYALYYTGKCYESLGDKDKADYYIEKSGLFCQIYQGLAN